MRKLKVLRIKKSKLDLGIYWNRNRRCGCFKGHYYDKILNKNWNEEDHGCSLCFGGDPTLNRIEAATFNKRRRDGKLHVRTMKAITALFLSMGIQLKMVD